MKSSYAGLVSAVIVLGATARAQAPVFFPLPLGSGTRATDVSTYNGNVVVVGTLGSGSAFRWTPAGGMVTIGVATPANSGTVRISTDGSTIVGDYKPSAPSRAAIWAGGTTWNPIPGLGGSIGEVESAVGGINGDGTVIVGGAYTAGGTYRAYRWNAASGTTTGIGFFNDPQSKAFDVSDDGSLIVGWRDIGGPQVGVRWKSPFASPTFGATEFFYNGTLHTGEGTATNSNGTIVIGRLMTGAGAQGFRWDAGPNTVSLLPNLSGDLHKPYLYDLTDNGSRIVGHNGATGIAEVPTAVIWVNGVPQTLMSYLTGLGMAPTGFSDLGIATAISPNGDAIVGWGYGGTTGEPEGWVVLTADLLATGTPFCFGDGSGNACPCAHVGASNSGCPNGSSAAGGKLLAFGDASIANDTLVLKSTQCPPNGPGLYFQGSAQIAGGANFGNGLLCLTGSTPRLEIRFADAAGTAQTTVSISSVGANAIGDVRNYQMWYRDDPSFCPNSGFNLTNAVNLAWNP